MEMTLAVIMRGVGELTIIRHSHKQHAILHRTR